MTKLSKSSPLFVITFSLTLISFNFNLLRIMHSPNLCLALALYTINTNNATTIDSNNDSINATLLTHVIMIAIYVAPYVKLCYFISMNKSFTKQNGVVTLLKKGDDMSTKGKSALKEVTERVKSRNDDKIYKIARHYRFPLKLVQSFEEAAQRLGVKPKDIIEELMKYWVTENSD